MVTIGKLPDEILLDIFEFYMKESKVEQWLTLVHVCREWRSIVFASPRRLHLCVVFKGKTPVREMQDIWPALPILIRPPYDGTRWQGVIADNVVAALEHRGRVCGISLPRVPNSTLGRFVTKMQYPFPELTSLSLECRPSRR